MDGDRRHFRWIILAALVAPGLGWAQEKPLDRGGDAQIRRPLGDSEIVLTTTRRLAGAVHSLTWNGQEFIDSADHGRQLQSASNLDGGGPIFAETFNPTEAGSRRDGAGPTSSSRLLHLLAAGTELQTTNQMAFWLAPGEESGGKPAKNSSILSHHLVTKRISLGYRTLPNVIPYRVTFSLPIGERHHQCVFEVVTGYMPPEFSKFLKFNPETAQLEPLTDGPGEQPLPVVLATDDERFAMGVLTPERKRPGLTGPGYGRFRFKQEKVVKWNCVFRLHDPEGVKPGEYSFQTFVVIGDTTMVKDALIALSQEFR